VNRERDAVEEGNGAEAFGDVLGDQDRRHGFSLRGEVGLPAPHRTELPSWPVPP
jgi:hypothetical protein